MERRGKVEPLLDDSDEHASGDGDPDLGLDRVLRGAEERLDPQMLLDPFEEQFDLPPLTVELGDRQCRQGEVVGEEDQLLAGLGSLKRTRRSGASKP